MPRLPPARPRLPWPRRSLWRRTATRSPDEGARPPCPPRSGGAGMSASADDKLPASGLPGLCRHLRTKRYYYGSTDEVLEVADLSTTAQFWCLRTMRVVGPDEGFV